MPFISKYKYSDAYLVRKYPLACLRVIPNFTNPVKDFIYNGTNTGLNIPCELSNGIYSRERIGEVEEEYRE